jgi:hypothetical protein
MKWGEYIVFVLDVKGQHGNFFTGTKKECELVNVGIELAGGRAGMVKPKINVVVPKGELKVNNRVAVK